MFATAPLLAAIQADRRRQFVRVARERQLLDGQSRADEATNRSSAPAGTGSSLSVGAHRTGTNGPACEAL